MEDVLRNPARVRGQSRDQTAFETIFSEHYPRIVAVLERVLGDRAEAEEAAMDVFSKLYQQPLNPDQDHNFGGWLYRTATRLGLDRLRSERRRRGRRGPPAPGRGAARRRAS